MTTVTTTVALLAITALTVWTLGSVLLRSLGALGVAAGLMLAATGTAAGLAVAVAGALAWLGGHALYATRHHTYRSPLARRIYTQTPMKRLDVTRGWVIPTSWPTTPKQTGRTAPGPGMARRGRGI
jgi:hypothetical protein